VSDGAPEVDDEFSIDVNGQLSGGFASTFEIGLEKLSHGLEAGLDTTLDCSGRHALLGRY